MRWMELLFPCRTHLEAEVEYLRAQLAQKDRRLDEMQQALSSNLKFWQDKSKEEVKRRLIAAQEKKPLTGQIQPRGWDQVRATMRLNPKPEPQDSHEENQNGVEK